jgi:PAS domain S-box-containing protein
MAPARRALDLMKTLERVRVPSFVADSIGTITWLNEVARSVFGDLEGRPFTAIVAPTSVATVERQLERKQQGAATTNYDAEVVTADGRQRAAEISSVRVEDGDQCHAIFGVVLVGPHRLRDAPEGLGLTPRQTEVLHLIAQGASTDQVAARLHLSRETVRNHVRHIFRALGVHSRVEAVAVAYQSGLL